MSFSIARPTFAYNDATIRYVLVSCACPESPGLYSPNCSI